MILCNEHIKYAFDSGLWKAYRNGEQVESGDLHINPNSIDVSLGNQFLISVLYTLKLEDILPHRPDVTPPNFVDLHNPNSVSWKDITVTEEIHLQRDGFVLAHTAERFDCSAPLHIKGEDSYFIPQLEGRSTVARCGLSVHSSAGYGDVGFSSSWTLELTTALPIILRPGDRIAQVFFVEASSGTVQYNGAYTDQHDGPRAPVLGKERFR